MSTAMSRAERERFLSEPHIGVLSVAVAGEPAELISVPIWYAYDPATGVSVITSNTSVKGVALEAAGRFCLVAQNEQIPYRYVSVEGPIADIHETDVDGELLPMSVHYFGEELGARYTAQVAGDATLRTYVMRPERWRTSDLTPAFDALRSQPIGGSA